MNRSANAITGSCEQPSLGCRPTFSHVIDRKRVAVYDGLLPGATLKSLCDVVSRAAYTRSESARPDTAQFRHWATEISLAALPTMPFMAPTLHALEDFDGIGYRPYRSYVNVAHFGDVLLSHVDCLPGAGEITALWYVCEQWDRDWGGETVFFDVHNEARALVTPKPGRLVLFDGDLLHTGKPPNRNCYQARYTLALKFERAARPAAT
ncbi:MAG: 2OG-Fe(II) oxygenase [Pseudomonadota bacterium]|nr:2OG-Fe(II) oxygenase [Pseudomonadota bacterium]